MPNYQGVWSLSEQYQKRELGGDLTDANLSRGDIGALSAR